jgi:hypothetical protein
VVALIGRSNSAGRVDLQPTGNRVIHGRGGFGAVQPLSIALAPERTAVWMLPITGTAWLAVLDDGSIVQIDVDDEPALTATTWARGTTLDVGAGPPVAAGDSVVPSSTGRNPFAEPLPDTRMVTDGRDLFALSGPTDRSPPAVLGDAVEASAVAVVGEDGSRTTPIVPRRRRSRRSVRERHA